MWQTSRNLLSTENSLLANLLQRNMLKFLSIECRYSYYLDGECSVREFESNHQPDDSLKVSHLDSEMPIRQNILVNGRTCPSATCRTVTFATVRCASRFENMLTLLAPNRKCARRQGSRFISISTNGYNRDNRRPCDL